jgi:hypothetical protein
VLAQDHIDRHEGCIGRVDVTFPSIAHQAWRVWFKSSLGDECYVDVLSTWKTQAIFLAHEHFRGLHNQDPMRGWWMDRWQRLACPAGHRLSLHTRPRLFYRKVRRWLSQ